MISEKAIARLEVAEKEFNEAITEVRLQGLRVTVTVYELGDVYFEDGSPVHWLGNSVSVDVSEMGS